MRRIFLQPILSFSEPVEEGSLLSLPVGLVQPCGFVSCIAFFFFLQMVSGALL